MSGVSGRADFRVRVALRIDEGGHFPRELGRMIASYVPLFSDEVRWRFPPDEWSWPKITAGERDEKEELFPVERAAWLKELGSVYFMHASLTPLLFDFIENYHFGGEVYLTPQETLEERIFRVALQDNHLLVLTFPIRMTRGRALVRFNERILLLLSDLKTCLAPQDPVLESLAASMDESLEPFSPHGSHPQRNMINMMVVRNMASSKAHRAMSASIARARPFVERRDPSLFKQLFVTQYGPADTNSDTRRINVHLEAIWLYASPHSREAIWRALEDLLDLDIQIHQAPS